MGSLPMRNINRTTDKVMYGCGLVVQGWRIATSADTRVALTDGTFRLAPQQRYYRHHKQARY